MSRAPAASTGLTPAAAAPRAEIVPPRAQWYQEPRQIFSLGIPMGELRSER
jgi:hypothetical protein